MFKVSRFSSFKTLNSLVAVLLLATFALAGFAGKPAYAASPRLELSVSSGPTGMYLTIRGFNQQQNLINGYDYGLLTFQNDDPSKNLPPFLTFGAASIKSDGTFTWEGPLPRSGYYDTPDGPQSYQVPLGHMKIVFFEYNGFDGGEADFNVTANTDGPFADDTNTPAYSMDRLWKHTDQLIAAGEVSRSWLWGPRDSGNGFVTLLEPYAEASHGWRFVTYYDKTRMEVTNPSGDLKSPYYVTNGLLVNEMVTGKMQLGDNTFQNSGAAKVPTAGDLSSSNKSPTYAAWSEVLHLNPYNDGDEIRWVIEADGSTFDDTTLPNYTARAGHFVKDTSHYIASPFWDYLNSTGLLKDDDNKEYTGKIFDPLYYATGYPITEAYWTKTVVGGVEKDVLVQLFERRVLTYTPSNPPAYRVEMGNVGLQYYQWRYNRG